MTTNECKALRIWVSPSIGLKITDPFSTKPGSPRNEWCKLKHGDEITVWKIEKRETPFVKLRFECYLLVVVKIGTDDCRHG